MDTVQDEARHTAQWWGNSTNSHSLLCVLRPAPWPSRRRCVLEYERASANSEQFIALPDDVAICCAVKCTPGATIPRWSHCSGFGTTRPAQKKKMFPGLGSFSRHDAIYKAAKRALTAATPHATRVWDPGLGARQVHSAHIVPPSPILCFVCVKRLTFLFYVQ